MQISEQKKRGTWKNLLEYRKERKREIQKAENWRFLLVLLRIKVCRWNKDHSDATGLGKKKKETVRKIK